MPIADIAALPCLWERLKSSNKPIVLYGMGDGAQKALDVMRKKGVYPSGIMASDDFVRGHSFAGFKVKKYSDIKAEFNDFTVLVCFGTQRPEVMENILRISRERELYVPDLPVTGGGLFDKEYALKNKDKLNKVYSMLADEHSRRLYNGWISFRITGIADFLLPLQTDRREAYPLLKLNDNEIFADLGAFSGDTAEEFISAAGGVRGIYAFEPDAKSFERLKKRLSPLGDKLTAINAGAWDKEDELPFVAKGGRNSGFVPFSGGLPPKASSVRLTPMKSLDDVVGENEVTVIKFDTEGCEEKAIDGCRRTIQRCRPKLIVSLYHRASDIFTLPLKLAGLCPDYKMYLREPPYLPAWDMELYCV